MHLTFSAKQWQYFSISTFEMTSPVLNNFAWNDNQPANKLKSGKCGHEELTSSETEDLYIHVADGFEW